MVPYWLMYRLGFTPWEREPVTAGFRDVLEGPDGLPPGRALDVGCGTGRHAVHLAKLGWQVTGVDMIEEALAKARDRAEREGVEAQWINGDVTDLGSLGLQSGYTLLYDFGCLHSLSDSARTRVAAGMTALAGPGATLLLLGLSRGHRVLLPRGIAPEEVAGLFGAPWKLLDARDITDRSMPLPVRRAHPHWYRLVRQDTAG